MWPKFIVNIRSLRPGVLFDPVHAHPQTVVRSTWEFADCPQVREPGDTHLVISHGVQLSQG
ncbi:hypothetical protein ADL01_15080 [Streptomyces sp. NRRL WC-3618]|nr:hypothetical protein ADL01_15080 [Streptomyces sp. NRRL WC-3618]